MEQTGAKRKAESDHSADEGQVNKRNSTRISKVGIELFEDADDFRCPISSVLMADPVSAEDGRTYERECIEAWFQTCQEKGVPVTSPWTRAPMGTRLHPNDALRGSIDSAVHEKFFHEELGGMSSVMELRRVFAHLDPLRKLLAESLQGWQPPQVVLVGSESSGKSSLLERLVMMPMLPTDEGICTRLPIHVRLRTAATAKAPRLEVFNTKNETTEEGPWVIPAHSGALDVRAKMNEIITRKHGHLQGVSTEHIIILHVEGPHVPSIDLVDMPGLLLAPPALRDETRKVLEAHVERHGAYSFYLGVVPASVRINTSIAMEFIQAKKLEERTLGVLTKCDELSVKKLGHLKALLGRPAAEHLGAVELAPHGWYATMNAPLEGWEGSSFGRLRMQAEAEVKFFQEHVPDLVESEKVSCGGLVKGLSSVFVEHVRTTWAPKTLKKLEEALEEARVDNALLGLPALNEATAENVARTREVAAAAAQDALEAAFPRLSRECCVRVLDPLKKRLLGLVKEERSGLRVEDAEGEWAGQEDQVMEACIRAAEDWEAFWLEGALTSLEARACRPAGQIERQRMLAAPPVQLGRFPAYVKALMGLVRQMVSHDKATIVDAVRRCVRRFHEDLSPWVHWETQLGGETPTVSVRCDRKDLVESLVLTFIRRGRGIILTAGKALEVAGEVIDDGWVECCGKERLDVYDRIAGVERAKVGLLQALGLASADELLRVRNMTHLHLPACVTTRNCRRIHHQTPLQQ